MTLILSFLEIINIHKPANGQLWDIQELSDCVLEDAPAQKKKKKEPFVKMPQRKGGSKKGICDMLNQRLLFLRRLQESGWDVGHREVMCFLFRNFSLQAGKTEKEATKEALEFNKGFRHPLKEKEVLGDARPRKLYRYQSLTLLRLLDVSEKLAAKLGFTGWDRAEYFREYAGCYYEKVRQQKEKAGETKKAMMDAAVIQVKSLRKAGKKIKDIAETLYLSVSTVKNYLAIT